MNQDLTKLSPPDPANRLTLMVSGGQASGKGSSIEKLKAITSDAGIEWRNIAKINTDSYKSLLLEPGTVKPELYSQLAQEEASVIHQKVQKRLTAMANQGQAPHVFVDQVFVGKDKIDFGLIGGGEVIGIIVSTDVNDAIERSFARGVQAGDKGRYENTKGILRGHKLMTAELPELIAHYTGKNASFLLFDNNVAKGEQAGLVMSIHLKEKEIEIYSEVNLQRFAQKCQINVDATSANDLYTAQPETDSISNYLGPLINENTCAIKASHLTSTSPNQYEREYLDAHPATQEETYQRKPGNA